MFGIHDGDCKGIRFDANPTLSLGKISQGESVKGPRILFINVRTPPKAIRDGQGTVSA